MKFITLFLVSLVSITTFAKTNTTATSVKPNFHTKSDKKFTLEFLLATEQTKEIYTKQMDGSYTKLDASLLQHLTKNDELRYFLSTRYVDSEASKAGNELEVFFAELMYRRKNILTESSNGIYMEAELKNYRVIDEDIKNKYAYDGAIIPQLIFKKNFGRSASAKIKVRSHFYQANNDKDYTLEKEDRIYLSGAFMIGRRVLLNTQLKYQHKVRKGSGWDFRYGDHFEDLMMATYNPITHDINDSLIPKAKKHQEIVTLHTGPLYFLSRNSMLEVYAETKLSNTYDKRDLETIMKDEFVLGAALYLTAF
jgi:hypothetical protein